MQQTLNFVTRQLTDIDRFSIVSFDSSALVVTGLKRMNSDGKESTLKVIEKIAASGGTDIADGLLLGLNVLRARASQKTVASLLLLTDGQDSGSLAKLDQVMQNMPNCSIHCFGFGSDHDAKVLMAITQRVQGTFTYVEDLKTVGPAFAATLGGLCSIVAQDIRITLRCGAGSSLVALHTKFTKTLADDKLSATVQLPDLFGSESRDIVFELHLGEREGADEIQEAMIGSVEYMPPSASVKTRVDASALRVLRPTTQAANAKPSINVDVNAQRNRVLTSDALQKAAALADGGNLTAARESLEGAVATIKTSPSALHPLCVEVSVWCRANACVK